MDLLNHLTEMGLRLRYRLALAPGATIQRADKMRIVVTAPRGELTIDVRSSSIAEAMGDLARHDISELELAALARISGGEALEREIEAIVATLKRLRALSYEVSQNHIVLARVFPMTQRCFRDRLAGVLTTVPKVRPHSYLQAGRAGLRVYSPLADAEVAIESSIAARFVAQLCAPGPPGCLDPDIAIVFNVLADAGHCRSSEPDAPGLAEWSFHDTWFHVGSRVGAIAGPFGRHLGHEAPAQQSPAERDGGLQLPSEPFGEDSVDFLTVLRARQSRREPGKAPLRLVQLSRFLSLSAQPIRMAEGPKEWWKYPYPSPGGIYATKLYLVVYRCEGLKQGLYEYDAPRHRLFLLNAPTDWIEKLSTLSGNAIGLSDQKPDVTIAITADIRAIAGKYDAIAYRLIMLTTGCLIQNMYLAASALGFAGCAIGGSDPVIFHAAAGTRVAIEPSMAEFALSGAPQAATENAQTSLAGTHG